MDSLCGTSVIAIEDMTADFLALYAFIKVLRN